MTTRIILIVSLVLNSALLMAVLGIVPFFLYISILIIAGLSWFIQKLLFELSDVNEDIQNLFDLLSSLQQHIESVHELEMFYGDETLGELLRHTKDMVSTMEDYKDKYSTISEFETEELEER
jgi:ABC-type multidrug transport system fused ATPase/permease subunit